MKRPVGLEAIIVYKLAKAVGEAGLGFVAVWLILRGAEAGAASLAEVVLEHFTGGWALKLATLLVRAGTSRHIQFVAGAAFADAALSAVEGLALRAGRWWAPWLVVCATGSLLPWEVWELYRRPAVLRVIVLIVNIGVLVYLLRAVAAEHRHARGRAHGPEDQHRGETVPVPRE
jgi:uncharacterized membrane protein (DUF2068 family)